ncbi:mercuric reductase [bacterium BMS3Abin03]|nr:mercuric reductase [bacterium BMS3Abin03]
MKQEIIKLEISGMTCDGCARTIEKKFEGKEGILDKSVSYPKGEGTFTFDASKIKKEDIIETINSIEHYKVKSELNNGHNTENNFDLIIVGGGSAAFSAAIKASELEKKVLMINDGLPIGGTCVNVGCVPSKTLIRTAEAFYNANHPNFTGVKPGANKIDFKEVINQKRELVNGLRQKKYVDVISDDPNVTVLKGRAKLTGKNSVEVNGETKTAGTILIATGSSTFIPDIPGLKDSGYYINDTLYELEELPERLIIIGGRYIALENAQLFARLGAKVTVLQRSIRILPTEMPDITENLSDYLKEEGINIKTGVKIHSVTKQNGKVILKVSVKNSDEIIEGTHLLVATGRKGNTNNLGLEKLGIETHGNGFIKTDEYQRTSVPNIYAAGDITGEHLFVYTAAYAGALAVENAFIEGQKEKDYTVLPWVIFTDPQVAGVGMDENQAYADGIDYDTSVFMLKDIPRALAARNTKGFIKLIRNKETGKLIGARILASEGSELLMEVSLAIKYGITVKEIRQMFHPYLTLSEGIKLAAITFDKDVNKLSCCAV